MSQHDMNIANQGFPAFRSDLNNALTALASNSSGASAPSTTFANQFWYETDTNLLKLRNEDNDAWITLAYFDQTNDEWEIRSAVIQAVDSAGVTIKNDGGTTLIEAKDDGTVVFRTDDVTIDASGNLLVGKTAESGNTAGHFFSATGYQRSTRDGSIQIFNRITTDGNIIDFQKDGSAVGSIGTHSGHLTIGNSSNTDYGTGLKFTASTQDVVEPWNLYSNTTRDNVIDLGTSSNRFKDLYLSGGVYLGGTGSANKLTDYEEGTWTPVARSENGDASVTTTVISATYTKVGNLVNVRCYIEISVTSVGTGNARITGLPFTNNGGYTPFTSTHETFAGSTGQGWVRPTDTVMEFLNANTTTTRSISGTGTKYAMISLTYKTDS